MIYINSDHYQSCLWKADRSSWAREEGVDQVSINLCSVLPPTLPSKLLIIIIINFIIIVVVEGVDQVSINLCSMFAEHASPSSLINFCSSSHIQCLHSIRHHRHYHYDQVHINLYPSSNIQCLHYHFHHNHHYHDQRLGHIQCLLDKNHHHNYHHHCHFNV